MNTRHLSLVGVALAMLASCGIIDGLLWPHEVTDQQLCDAVAAREADAARCPGSGEGEGEGEGSKGGPVGASCNASCLREASSRCGKEWEALLTCELDEKHSCGDLSAGSHSFCDSVFAAYTACAGLPADGCSSGTNTDPCLTCNGGRCDSKCDVGENGACPDCPGPQPQCNQCNGATCNSFCEGAAEVATCPDCQEPSCGACVSGRCDGACQAGETAPCPDCSSQQFQCAQCNGGACDGFCAGTEVNNCPDCHQASCGSCPGGSCDGVCETGEPTTCPDCPSQQFQCNQCAGGGCNGVCQGAAEFATCPDCHDPACGSCLGSACDGTCNAGETATCPDCTGATLTCASDADCGAGELCDAFGDELCPGINCLTADQQRKCRRDCSAGGAPVCTATEDCVATRGDGTQRVCEQQRCPSPTQCDNAIEVCARPFEMDFQPGFCLDKCDPNACFNGGTCNCQAPFSRCATVRNAGNPQVFACTATGSQSPGFTCNAEGDCKTGLTCASGICRAYCFQVGTACPGGTCQPLLPGGGPGFCGP